MRQRWQEVDRALTITKFVPANAEIITKQVNGCGLGFAHVGIQAKAEEMGLGTTHDGYSSFPVYAPKIPDQHWGELLGWVISVTKDRLIDPCNQYGHSFDTLYPKSVYRCSACGTVHGTRAYGGAVNWQCPRELVLDGQYHEPAPQAYIGRRCSRCDEVVAVGGVA